MPTCMGPLDARARQEFSTDGKQVGSEEGSFAAAVAAADGNKSTASNSSAKQDDAATVTMETVMRISGSNSGGLGTAGTADVVEGTGTGGDSKPRAGSSGVEQTRPGK